jgi:hypothetical protein
LFSLWRDYDVLKKRPMRRKMQKVENHCGPHDTASEGCRLARTASCAVQHCNILPNPDLGILLISFIMSPGTLYASILGMPWARLLVQFVQEDLLCSSYRCRN